MRSIAATPLTPEAFEPFGDVLEPLPQPGRRYVSRALANGRAKALPSLSVTLAEPASGASLVATRMERHEYSSQSFLPLDVSRYLILVAPRLASGRPDESRLVAFVARGDQAITYAMNVWHHPMVVLDRPGRFAISMWLQDGSGTDEEFVDLAAPVEIGFPG